MRTISPGKGRNSLNPFRPSIARSGDYFIVATTDTLIRDMLAARTDGSPGSNPPTNSKKWPRERLNKATVSFCFAPVQQGDGRFAGRGPGGSGGRHAGSDE